MLEDYLKKKMGKEYSKYLDLPNMESLGVARSVPELKAKGSKPLNQIKKVIYIESPLRICLIRPEAWQNARYDPPSAG